MLDGAYPNGKLGKIVPFHGKELFLGISVRD